MRYSLSLLTLPGKSPLALNQGGSREVEERGKLDRSQGGNRT